MGPHGMTGKCPDLVTKQTRYMDEYVPRSITVYNVVYLTSVSTNNCILHVLNRSILDISHCLPISAMVSHDNVYGI